MKKTTKFLMTIAVLLATMAMSVHAQEPVNGKAFLPIPSTTDNPIYFYIESASNGTVNAGTWTTDARGQVVYPAESGHKMSYGDIPANKDNALWAFVAEGNDLNLYNKGTGFYLTESSNAASNASGVTVITTSIESTNGQFSIRSSNNTSYMLAWKENKLDRWSSALGANSLTAWYIVLPKDLDIAKNNAANVLINTSEGDLPNQFTTANRDILQDAIHVANQVSPSATNEEQETAAMTLNGAIEVYINSKNPKTVSAPEFSTQIDCAVIAGDHITINSESGTIIKYTTDGSDPYSSSSSVQTSTTNTVDIVINSATTVKAFAINTDGNKSLMNEANYTVLEGVTLGETYFVQFQRYNGDLTLEDMGESVQIQSVTLSSDNDAQKWTISKGSKNGLYTLKSINGRKIYYDGGFKAAANPTQSTDLRIIVSPNEEYAGYEIMRAESTDRAMNPIGGSATDHNIGEWDVGDGGNTLVFVDREDLCKIELQKALETANKIKNVEEGQNFGQVTTEQKDAFVTAVNKAQEVYDANNGGYCAARPTLTNAIATIKRQIVDLSKLQTSESNKYRWFTIRSASAHDYATDKVISSNGRNITDKFTFEEVDAPVSDAQLFRFELTDNGTAVANIINKATGAYMAQSGAIVATAAENSGTFTVTLLEGENGLSFKIDPSTANDIHAERTGNLVNWNGDFGSSSAWVFDFQKDLPKELTWTGSESTVWNNVNNWNPVSDPTNTDVVIPKTTNMPVASGNVSVNNLTIAPGASLTVNGDLNSTHPVILQGDATNGSATLISDNAVEGNMTYPLTAERIYYVSSPISNGNTSMLGSTSVFSHNASLATPDYEDAANSVMNAATGYVIKPSSDVSINFDGTFNNGEVVTKTVFYNGTSANAFRGYNLIGNPYPSALDWEKVWANSTNNGLLKSTMWYNEDNNFQTYNATGNLGSPATATAFIPAMQGFWVLYNQEASSVDELNGNLMFNNEMRTANSLGNNPLKAPKVEENQVLRLQLTTGDVTDETVLYFNAGASDSYDNYDSPKMFNKNMPAIYTQLEGNKLVINGMQAIPYDTEIVVSFLAKEEGNYTITANEFSNFNGDKVWLRDKLTGMDTDLSINGYNFTANTGVNTDRFSIIFPRLDAPTGLEETLNDALSLSVDNGNLQVRVTGLAQDAMVSVFNSLGQRVASQSLRGTVTTVNLSHAGVYVVKVMNGSEELTEKVVVR